MAGDCAIAEISAAAEAEASTAFLSSLASEQPNFQRLAIIGRACVGLRGHRSACVAGRRVRTALLDHSLRVWSTLAVSLIHAYDPEVLVVGGGIMASSEIILPAMQKYVAQHAHTPWGKVKVVPSAPGRPRGPGGSRMAGGRATGNWYQVSDRSMPWKSNYDKFPFIQVPQGTSAVLRRMGRDCGTPE